MARTIINIAYLMGALCIAWVLEVVGSTGWNDALVNNRVWGVPFGWLSWPHLVAWLFLFLLFLALGIAITWVVRSPRSLAWAGALGASFSALQFALSSHVVFEQAGFFGYFWMYGQYLVPPAGSLAGGGVASWLSASRLQRVHPVRGG